jgi:hypothetical protein
MSDGTVSNSNWKTKVFFKGPLNSNLNNPTVQYWPIPANWFAPDFDDRSWDQATVYSTDRSNPMALTQPPISPAQALSGPAI